MEDRSQLPDHLTPESTPIQDIQTGRPAAGRARHPHQSALAASPPMAGNNRWVIWLAVRLRIKRCRCEGQFKKKTQRRREQARNAWGDLETWLIIIFPLSQTQTAHRGQFI